MTAYVDSSVPVCMVITRSLSSGVVDDSLE